MTDTAPLPLPLAGNTATRGGQNDRLTAWIDRLVAAGVEPRGELLLAGDGVTDAALAAARLVGPRGRILAVVASEAEAAGLGLRAADAGAGQVEVLVAADRAPELGRTFPLVLRIAAVGESPAERAAALARFEPTLARGGRALELEAPG